MQGEQERERWPRLTPERKGYIERRSVREMSPIEAIQHIGQLLDEVDALTTDLAEARARVAELLSEMDRLRSHNAYLTEVFYGIASWKVCDRHNAVSIVDRARYDRVVNPSCQDCRAEDLAALAAGNPEATTMAARLKETSARNLSLTIENHRLKERLEPARRPAHPGGEED